MQATIDTNKHTGTLSGLILLLAASEHITFEGATIPDNTTAAIVSPAGVTLASGLITSNAVSLNTQTAEAYDYITAQPVASSAPAFLAVGDNTTTLAVFPIRVLRNHLYDMAPPSVSADIYPHRDELLAILSSITSASERVDELLGRAEEIDTNIGQVVADFDTAVTAAQKLLTTEMQSHQRALEKSAADLVGEMDEFASEALQDLTREKEDALQNMNAVKEQVEELAASAETSATASAASAEQAEAALALVPEIAIDADSVLEASRLLVGTDPSQLLTLSESI